MCLIINDDLMFKGRMSLKSKNSMDLRIKNVTIEDSATYFCRIREWRLQTSHISHVTLEVYG